MQSAATKTGSDIAQQWDRPGLEPLALLDEIEARIGLRPTPLSWPVGIRRCGTSWLRDAVPAACATCGGTDLERRPQPTTAYSRGSQVSIVGWRQVPLCVVCDAAMLSRSLAGKPVPNSYRPAAMTRREPGDGGNPVSILPR